MSFVRNIYIRDFIFYFMRKVFLGVLFCLMLLSLVSADFNFSAMTGKVIDAMEENLSKVFEEDVALYGNEGLLINGSANFSEGFDYEFSFNEEDLDMYLGLLTCSFVKPFVDDEVNGVEVPEEVPFKDEILDVYLDDVFLVSLSLEDGKFQEIGCNESSDVTYRIYVKKELILGVRDMEDDFSPIDFYLENTKNGNLGVEPVGFGKKVKFWFINLGIRIASWFD